MRGVLGAIVVAIVLAVAGPAILGERFRPFVAVLDVGGEVFQIATARETTVLELARALLQVLEAGGVGSPRMVHAQPRLGDVHRNYSDTSKAREILGWESNVSLDEGLALTVAWFLGRVRPDGEGRSLRDTAAAPSGW